jgi:hypothetical protein
MRTLMYLHRRWRALRFGHDFNIGMLIMLEVTEYEINTLRLAGKQNPGGKESRPVVVHGK